MNDPYFVLGVNNSASDAEIKSAYKRLSMIHHPDRGGNEIKFKELTEAYDRIKHYRNNSTIASTFENFTHRRRPTAKNADVSISYDITYDEVVTGVDTIVRVSLPTNRYRDVRINIPAGVNHGHRIKFPGCGDNSNPNLYSGDLYVTIIQKHDVHRERVENDCHVIYELPVKDAMLGNKMVITGLLNKKYSVTIPPGTQHNTKFRIPNAGFPIWNTSRFGDLIITVEINIPIVTDDTILIRDL